MLRRCPACERDSIIGHGRRRKQAHDERRRQNKVRAWQILRSKLYALKKAEAEKARSDQRLGQIGSGERSERIRTYNFPQSRLTDHRIEGEDKNWSIQDIVAGKLEPLVAKLEEIRRSAGKGK